MVYLRLHIQIQGTRILRAIQSSFITLFQIMLALQMFSDLYTFFVRIRASFSEAGSDSSSSLYRYSEPNPVAKEVNLKIFFPTICAKKLCYRIQALQRAFFRKRDLKMKSVRNSIADPDP
jgi:hypothetical protein